MRDPESQTPATSPGLQALSRYHGSPWLEPFPVPDKGVTEPETGSRHRGLSSETPQKGPRVWGHKIGSAPLAPGLQARGCSPRASRPGAARYGSLCLKPFLYLKDGLTPIKTPAKLWVPCSETLGEVRRHRLHKMGCAPVRPGTPRSGLYLTMAHQG